MHRLLLVLLVLAPLACNVGGAATDPPTKPGPVRLGEPITAAAVALADIAKSPDTFASKVVTTTGVVTAVCQERGCWMELKDDTGGAAHVRMHGHAFFVPRTSSGKRARVQATVLHTDPNEGCTQEAAEQMGAPVAKIQLDATGVELLD